MMKAKADENSRLRAIGNPIEISQERIGTYRRDSRLSEIAREEPTAQREEQYFTIKYRSIFRRL